MSVFFQELGEPLQAASPAAESIRNAVPGTSQNTPKSQAQTSHITWLKIENRRKIATLFQHYKAKLDRGEDSVTVTSDPLSVEEKVCVTVNDVETVVPLAVKNCGATTVHLNFLQFELVKNIFSVTDCNGNNIRTIKELPLGPGAEYKIKVHFCSAHAGFYEHLLVFKFKTQHKSSGKMIIRLLEVTRRTSLDDEPLPKPATYPLCGLRTAGMKGDIGFQIVRLKFYPMPNHVKDLKRSNMELENMPLNWRNYCRRFRLLLHLEEFNMLTEMEKLNQDVAMFSHKSHKDITFLQAAEISRISPSFLAGMQVTVTPLEPKDFPEKFYKSWVRHVDSKAQKVYLEFNDGFLSCFKDGMMFHLKFSLNRMPLRTQHRAAGLVYACKLREVLFPTGESSSHQTRINRAFELENNPEQRQAVEHIVAATAKPAPYLVFGPPGTGKTVTLVEAIKRIVKAQPSCNILACAPSNSATDTLCEKILQEKIAHVYRLYALSWSVRKIPRSIKSCCNFNHRTGGFEIPLKEELMSYNIIVTSLQTASRLVSRGIPPAHYSYLFVDEASYSAETECLIPMAGLLIPHKCQVVLAGDPKQLGPIITSMQAENHGLGVSMLERLMNIDLYRRNESDGFNNRFVSKLLRNYRSHPAILKVPNDLFYNGELQSHADKKRISSFCRWEQLPKKGLPLIFHGVAGTNERDQDNPSLYNMAEVEVLKEYLKALVDHFHKKGVKKIEPNNIGIISPYRKQVEKIYEAFQTDKDLRKENLENVLVGSVEQFQGKEFTVTLVSTVRSMRRLTAPNKNFTLGFVDSEKRFNVAMTRAQALLIVIGDPRVLKTDPNWNTFIHYCFTSGCYRGIAVSDEKDQTVPPVTLEGSAATGKTCCSVTPQPTG